MNDITKIKVNGEPESSYQLYPRNNEFAKRAGGGGGGGGGEITTLHINVTAVNLETMEATFTADKTPAEMQQASANGPIWCVVTFAAGLMARMLTMTTATIKLVMLSEWETLISGFLMQLILEANYTIFATEVT